MKTSTKILIFLLAVSLVANGGLLYKYCDMKNQVEAGYDTMDNVYQQNLGLLSTHCTDLENGLSKILVSNQTERIASLLKDAVEDSGAASAALSSLPLYPDYVAKFNRCLNQLSDYCGYLLTRCANGETLTQETIDNISKLQSSVTAINSSITELEDILRANPMNWHALSTASREDLETLDNVLISSFDNLQNEGIDYPALIYDGPFSDSVVNKEIEEPEGTDITKEEAVDIAKKFMDAGKDVTEYSTQETSGLINIWSVVLQKGDSYYYFNIAKRTGEVINFINSGESYEEKISREDAVSVAQQFLEKNGYSNMVPQFCQVTNGNATINFVREENGVLIYPDMVKVRVDMCNSVVNGFEGMSYYANHRKERDIPTDLIPADQLTTLLRSDAQLESCGIAIIPTDGENEQLCYEFRCNIDSDTYIYYYDAQTLKEAKIFKVLNTEGGDFVV